MIREYTISSTEWTAITSAGQEASAWFKSGKGKAIVLVSHSDTGSPPRSKNGFRLWYPITNSDVTILGPANDDDVFFARVKRSGDTVKILVDAED